MQADRLSFVLFNAVVGVLLSMLLGYMLELEVGFTFMIFLFFVSMGELRSRCKELHSLLSKKP